MTKGTFIRFLIIWFWFLESYYYDDWIFCSPSWYNMGEEEDEKIFKILLKDSHHNWQIMSQRDAEDELYWK